MSFTASKFQVRQNVHQSSVKKSIFIDEKAQFEEDLEQQTELLEEETIVILNVAKLQQFSKIF